MCDYNVSKIEEIKIATKAKLLEYNLIFDNDNIQIYPNYFFELEKVKYCHYIVNCINSGKRYTLKMQKSYDGLKLFNDSLKLFNTTAEEKFSVMLVPPFSIGKHKYYILSFIEGQSLDEVLDLLNPVELEYVSKKIIEHTNTLKNITAIEYSEKNVFLGKNCATIFNSKLIERISYPLIDELNCLKKVAVLKNCADILENSTFSIPSLLHMDIKPANIIYNRENGALSLIDFELARFGDIDYGKAQVFLSGLNSFSNVYKKEIYPILINKECTPMLSKKSPKYKCYCFYQLLCNLIYYDERSLEFPYEMKQTFHELAKELSQ